MLTSFTSWMLADVDFFFFLLATKRYCSWRISNAAVVDAAATAAATDECHGICCCHKRRLYKKSRWGMLQPTQRADTDTHTRHTHTEWEVSGFLFYSDKTSSGQCVHCTHCQSHILQWSHLWIHLHTWTAATTRPHLLPQQTLHACIQPHIYIYWLSKSRDLKHLCSRNVSHSKCETKTMVQSLGKKTRREERKKNTGLKKRTLQTQNGRKRSA